MGRLARVGVVIFYVRHPERPSPSRAGRAVQATARAVRTWRFPPALTRRGEAADADAARVIEIGQYGGKAMKQVDDSLRSTGVDQ
jgi:hypothetical protein